jgi:hypothetical protein
VQGIDTTPTTFSIDVLDEGNNLEAQWVTSPPQTSSTWSTATQDAVIGNPAPSYAIAFEEIHNAIDQPYAFRNFGIAAATLIKVTCEFRFDGDTSCKQALLHVANDVAGSGVLAYYQIGGELASGKLEIRKATAWGLFNSVGVDSVALAALAAGTIYRFEATVLVNSDGTQTVTLALFNGVTQLATVTATNRFTIGDYMGFAGGDPVDLAGPAITHYDNLHVMATGATGLVPEQTATSYVYTFVNSLGEESAPSPTSATVLRPDGVSITVTTPTTTPGGTDPLYNIVEKRIYRAVTGSTGTVFQRVTTIPLATADYVDVLYDSELSKDVLESEDWDLPPPTLQGIIPLPNGIMAGFFGNQLCLSVRLRPHAWPVLYRLPVDTDIVAIANIDNTIVIGTKSFVYTATGNDPGSYSMSQPGSPQACVSKLSMRFLEGIGVVFASPDGYQVCSGSASAVRNATALTFTKRQWESLLPSSIISGVYDGVLYFFFTGTTPDRGYALDVKPNGFGLVRLSFHATAMHTDPLTDSMHLVLDVNSEPTDAALPLASTAVTPNGLRLFQFDAAPDSDMVFRWRGKLNLMPYPITLTIAQVRAASFTNLVAKFYADADRPEGVHHPGEGRPRLLRARADRDQHRPQHAGGRGRDGAHLMATERKIGFSTPREGEWKILAQAVDNIREQLGRLDTRVADALALIGGSTSVKQIAILQAQIAQLSATVNALSAGSGSTLTNLLAQPNGLVVVRDGQLVTRILTSRGLINILFPDGHDGNPIIFIGLAGTGEEDSWTPPFSVKVQPHLASRQPWWGISEDRV